MRLFLLQGVALLLLGGCSSSNPSLYSLDARPGPVRAGVSRVVVVRAVGLPRYLDRQEVVRASGQVRLLVADNDWWGEPLRAMLKRVLISDISQRLPKADVLADDSPISVRPDAEIEMDVQRFDRDSAGQVTFIGHAAVERAGRRRELQSLRFDAPVAGSTTRDQVEAMSTVLGQVADAAAQMAAQ